MFSRALQIIKIPVTFITIVVLLFGFMCVGMFSQTSMSMSGMNMGMMSGDHTPQCCTLGTTHHLDAWKNIILVSPDKVRDSLILLASVLVLAFGYSWLSLRYRSYLFDPNHIRLRLYVRDNPDLILFNPLRLAFARGILNTKVY